MTYCQCGSGPMVEDQGFNHDLETLGCPQRAEFCRLCGRRRYTDVPALVTARPKPGPKGRVT